MNMEISGHSDLSTPEKIAERQTWLWNLPRWTGHPMQYKTVEQAQKAALGDGKNEHKK